MFWESQRRLHNIFRKLALILALVIELNRITALVRRSPNQELVKQCTDSVPIYGFAVWPLQEDLGYEIRIPSDKFAFVDKLLSTD